MEQVNDPLYKLRHSLAHVLAQAVLQIRPDSKLAFGPPIDNGCYYDFDFKTPLTPEDFSDIEKRMRKIIGERQKFVESKLPLKEAVKFLADKGEIFKVEYCEELGKTGEQEIGFYTNGSFVDMCRGPHVEHTGQIPPDSFAIDSLAGAYWRGSEKNPQLTRIYVLAFENKHKLAEYIEKRKLAEERDHRKLGKELDLFSINNEMVGAGLILWHPKGAIVRHLIEEHCKNRHLNEGYDFVYTPHIGRSVLWKTSGHLDFYKDGMFAPIEIEGQEFYLKPMNCPFHCQIFNSGLRSYRDLPKRFAEWGTVYRFEKSGTLHGLTRVRGFTQDDAHLFCRRDQMPEEIDRVIKFCISILSDFGLKDLHLYLSTRPEKRVGAESDWDAAEAALREALERTKLPFDVKEGDGAFYGPKIDIQLNDALGRQWQLSTIQFDFNLPDRFKLSYTGDDGNEHKPFMIHRALLGSVERFFSILIEQFGGAFPTWLAPVQCAILPINQAVSDYAIKIRDLLVAEGVRVELTPDSESINKRIRTSLKSKIPNILVIGEKESQSNSVTWRKYDNDKQLVLPLDEFVSELRSLIQNRVI